MSRCKNLARLWLKVNIACFLYPILLWVDVTLFCIGRMGVPSKVRILLAWLLTGAICLALLMKFDRGWSTTFLTVQYCTDDLICPTHHLFEIIVHCMHASQELILACRAIARLLILMSNTFISSPCLCVYALTMALAIYWA